MDMDVNGEEKNMLDAQWHKECSYAHFLQSIPGIGAKTIEWLYTEYGDYEAIYNSLKTELYEKGDIKKIFTNGELQKTQRANLKQYILNKDVKEEYQKLLYNKMWCIPKNLNGYPDKLKEIHKPPAILYVKGKLPNPSMPVVAVVGARNCSPYGKSVAKELGRKLAESQIQVVSGLARGIDGVSQRSAMEAGGASFGILGCGVDVCYPEENIDIYRELADGKNGGGIISEYVPGTQPEARLFPMRNRIISGFSDILVVVEARQRSGTFITVTDALEQGKDVYVIPGRLGDGLSYGCNRLISQGAGIIYDMDCFVEMILDSTAYQQKKGKRKEDGCREVERMRLTEAGEGSIEDAIYQVLDIQYISLDEILTKLQSQISLQQILTSLATLECHGFIQSEGSFYRKINNII